MWIFFLGQLLHGAGAAPLYTLGVTFIDENISKKMSSVYIGENEFISRFLVLKLINFTNRHILHNGNSGPRPRLRSRGADVAHLHRFSNGGSSRVSTSYFKITSRYINWPHLVSA